MSSKQQANKDNKASIKRRLLRAEPQRLKTSDQRPHPVTLIQHARSDLLSSRDVLQLQHTINNRTVSRLLADRTQPHSVAPVVIQRKGETGLAEKKRVKSYTKTILENRGGWDSMSQYARIAVLLESANAQLAKVGVPEVRGLIDPLNNMAGTADNAAFNRGTWNVFFNPDWLRPGLSFEEFGQLANTVYHECRHAEQT